MNLSLLNGMKLRTVPGVLLGCFLILYVHLRATKTCLTLAFFPGK